VAGKFYARNRDDRPIDTLFVNVPQRGEFALRKPRLKLLLNDSAVYWRMYRFDPALRPATLSCWNLPHTLSRKV
jgi:hypothetical protein